MKIGNRDRPSGQKEKKNPPNSFEGRKPNNLAGAEENRWIPEKTRILGTLAAGGFFNLTRFSCFGNFDRRLGFSENQTPLTTPYELTIAEDSEKQTTRCNQAQPIATMVQAGEYH